MNYTTTLRDLKKVLKRTVNCGLPSWVHAHVEERIAYASHHWEASRAKESTKDFRDLAYRKAVLVLSGLHDLLGAFKLHVRDEDSDMPKKQTRKYPGFYAVTIPLSEWRNPKPQHEGERVLWSDGIPRNYPENEGDTVTVLRRCGVAP